MILTEVVNSKDYWNVEEYERLVDFHTYTGKDVYEYDSYTEVDFDFDEWNAQIDYFFEYYSKELSKASEKRCEELCPTLIYIPVYSDNELIRSFKDVDSFKGYIKEDIMTRIFDMDGEKSGLEVKITLNKDNTFSMIYYYPQSKNHPGEKSVFGYINKSSYDYLLSVQGEESDFQCQGLFDLSLYKKVPIFKIYLTEDNEYFETKVTINKKKPVKIKRLPHIDNEDIPF